MRQLDPKWTSAQKDAIRARGETLLVFAAAGSGKTAVLTERMIDRLLDAENALDLLSVLVVTFTKAAAAELMSRIRAALESEIAKNPGNKRLQTQLMNVGRAKICTIDSFCLELIRAHFETLGISPRVSVSDEAQAKLMARNVMNDLIDAYFDGTISDEAEQIDDFGAFTDLFTTSRSAAALADVFLEVRECVNGYEEGLDWLYQQADTLHAAARDGSAAFFASSYGKPLLEALEHFAKHWSARYTEMCAYLYEDEAYIKNYGACFVYEKEWCDQLSAILSDTHTSDNKAEKLDFWDSLRGHFQNFTAPPLKSGIRGEKKTEEIRRVKEQHDAFLAQKNAFASRYFTVTANELSVLNEKQAQMIDRLARFLSVYERRLEKEKRRRQTLDFGDLGRLALKLLWDRENHCPTQLAKQEAQHYSEIYIDEYQDVSPVQDRIFSAIAKTDNRFMVGDAKQSIYGFRGASPELFLGYRAEFAQDGAQGRTIFLSDNFRCDRQIINCSNRVFSVLFGHSDMPYTDDDALRYAKQTPEAAPPDSIQARVSLTVIPTNKEDDAEEDDFGAAVQEEPPEAPTEKPPYTEADYVADTIAHLLKTGRKHDGSRIRPRDIAILLRSAKTGAAPLVKALEARKIPSYNTVTRAFFENAEVLLMYSLLSVIDNPGRDVYLAGALKSPLYRVTLDELIYMRKQYPHGSLFDALQAFTKETHFAKGMYFLEKLAHYRRRAAGMPVDRFLWYLYQDTGILSLVYEQEHHALFSDNRDSAQMRANLMMLYEYARSFERGSFQGLGPFVSFIDHIIEDQTQLPPVLLSGEDADAVHIMTIHQSKGLEFPVCFLCGCAKKFNDSDTRKTVLLHRNTGIATYLRDDTGLSRIIHPARECVRGAITDTAREEEKRVLYVALTRAREQLYLTAEAKDPVGKLEAYRKIPSEDLTRERLLAEGNVLAWLFCALANAPDVCDISFPCENPYEEGIVSSDTVQPAPSENNDDDASIKPSYRAVQKTLDSVLSYQYPDEEKTKIPSKMSVSELLRLQTSESATESPAGFHAESEAETGTQTHTYAVPRFLQNTGRSQPTAAQRGTATHEFMQFCDYKALADETKPRRERIEAEIRRLTENAFLSSETAEWIDRSALAGFLKSSLFSRLQKAVEIRREMRFNLYVPAKRVYGDLRDEDAEVLVQGIIDCYYTDLQNRVILIDYKTDHFSKTALAHPKEVEATLRARHAEQLSYYCEAAEQLLCRPVYDVRIYSFALGYDFSVL